MAGLVCRCKSFLGCWGNQSALPPGGEAPQLVPSLPGRVPGDTSLPALGEAQGPVSRQWEMKVAPITKTGGGGVLSSWSLSLLGRRQEGGGCFKATDAHFQTGPPKKTCGAPHRGFWAGRPWVGAPG